MNALRVLAMFGIFFHHLGMTVIRDPQTALHRIFHSVAYSGADGVIFFNIISGFLLAYPYLGPVRRPFPRYGTFVRSRFVRIVPAYYIALLVITAANILLLDHKAGLSLQYMLEHAIFVNSFHYETLNLNTAAFWYLAMLAHFYLLFPFILRLFLRIGPTRAALSLITLSWVVCGLVCLYLYVNPNSVFRMAGQLMYFNLPVRLPEFVIGIWFASVWDPSASKIRESGMNRPFTFLVTGMALYALLCILFPERVTSIFYYILHVSAAVPLFVLLFLWRPMSRAAGSAMVGKLSRYSFCIYMVHQPIFNYVGVTPGTVPGTILEFFKLFVLLFPLSYLAAAVLDRAAGMVLNLFQRKPGAGASISGRERLF
jgi:peptidoglycan/LPS O-acetylase OafA/YrhL